MRRLAPLLLAFGLAFGTAAGAEESPPAPTPAPGPGGEDPSLEAADDLEAELLLEEEASRTAQLRDPLEPGNRGVLWFNRGVDWILVDPLTRGYSWIMPDPAERAVRRFFDNLASPSVLMNDLLQLRGRHAAITSARFVVNTTVGVAGLFDPAHRLGLPDHHSDFGQTLWVYGVRSGPYLMLPLFGPSTARDGFGRLVDGALRPDTWLLGGAPLLVLGVGDGLSLRAMHREALAELERSSVDYYAALRSVYWMDRQGVLRAALDETEETQGAEATETSDVPSP
ncbi:MAG TPA: VacJ family lipoprotein [Myxococcota bacterium]|nr:VacJ family lipoprotein [Myxococcota bacterium]